MGKVLVLYSKSTKKDLTAKYGKSCTYINTKRKSKDDIQGMRFTEVIVEDSGVSKEWLDFANLKSVLQSQFDEWNKDSGEYIVMSVGEDNG